MNQKGFTLLEILMVLLLLGILTSFAVTSVTNSANNDAFEITLEEMFTIRNAMVGDPDLKVRGIRTDFGYNGDVGALPTAIADLSTKPGGDTAWTTDTANRINHGWNGPYIRGGDSGSDYTRDAWGNSYTYTPGASPPTLVSLGADGAAGGTGLDQDISLEIPSNHQTATVHGFIVTGGAGNPENSAATIDLNYPDGSGALQTDSSSIIVGDLGYFSFASIPIGVRSATITVGATVIGPIIFTVDRSNYMIPTALTDTGGAPAACAAGTTTVTTDQAWAVPAGCTSLIIKAWGGGGGGGQTSNGRSGDGGGAGEVFSNTLTVSPGDTFTVTIGMGGNTGDAGCTGGGAGGYAGGAKGASAAGGAGGGGGAGGSGGAAGSYAGGAGGYGGGGGGGGSAASDIGGQGGGATVVVDDDSSTEILIAGGGGGGGGANGGGGGNAGVGGPGCSQNGSASGNGSRGGGGGGGACVGDNSLNGAGKNPPNKIEAGNGNADGGNGGGSCAQGDGGNGVVIFEYS